MNGAAIFGDLVVAGGPILQCKMGSFTGFGGREITTSAMAALGIAVAATSAAGRTSGSDAWAAASWSSGDHSATDSSGSPGDFSGRRW
jgi:hypothetical protein